MDIFVRSRFDSSCREQTCETLFPCLIATLRLIMLDARRQQQLWLATQEQWLTVQETLDWLDKPTGSGRKETQKRNTYKQRRAGRIHSLGIKQVRHKLVVGTGPNISIQGSSTQVDTLRTTLAQGILDSRAQATLTIEVQCNRIHKQSV